MDYKDFHDGLLSLSLVLFIFSITFLIGSIVLKPFIALEPFDRDFIIIISIINIIFSIYYLSEALRLNKTFKLDDKYITNFGKRIGIISLIYIPHIFLISSLLFRDLHNLQIMMTSLIIFIEAILIGVVFKEVYDLIFKEEAERVFELEKNRKLYFEK
ncbi:MAG: hypothetical protein ACFE8M_02375 [Candidatus Hermodarchaeota archaeon]